MIFTRLPKSTRIGILLLCALALATRVTGMHMHVPADGDLAHEAIHIADIGSDHDFHHEHDHDADAHQHANEVSLDNQTYAKKAGNDRDAGVWMAAAILLFFLQPPSEIFLSRRRSPALKLKPTPYLLPPLRGPPPKSLTVA